MRSGRRATIADPNGSTAALESNYAGSAAPEFPAPTGEPLQGHTDAVYAVDVGMLRGEEVVVSGSRDGTVRIWGADGSARGEPLEGHTGAVNAVARGVLGGEEVVVSGGDDGIVRLWGADRESLAISVGGSVLGLALSSSSSVVACGDFGLACFGIGQRRS
jgi:WD40 repeat protein